MKKANFVWSKLGNIILVLALLIVLVLAVYFMRDYMSEIWGKIVSFLRFGG